jgi:hypothetical protein
LGEIEKKPLAIVQRQGEIHSKKLDRHELLVIAPE